MPSHVKSAYVRELNIDFHRTCLLMRKPFVLNIGLLVRRRILPIIVRTQFCALHCLMTVIPAQMRPTRHVLNGGGLRKASSEQIHRAALILKSILSLGWGSRNRHGLKLKIDFDFEAGPLQFQNRF